MVDLLQGIRRVGAVTNQAIAGVNNATPLFTISTFASMVGVKSLRLRRLKLRSNAVGADTWVYIGTGNGALGTWVVMLPALRLVNNTTDDYSEYDLPAVNFTLTITFYVDPLPAGSIDAQCEVEEQG
jgi:hypothetical protein